MADRLGSRRKDSQGVIQEQNQAGSYEDWDHDPLTAEEQEAPSGLRQFVRDHRRALLALLTIGILIIFIFAVLPQIAGFGKSLHRLRYGNKVWLAAAIALECISLFGYMALLRLVFSCDGVHIAWRTSYQITMAGAVATKLLAAGGAGGIALTVWALRAAGLSAKAVARRMTSFEMLLYGVFMLALVIFGAGLAIRVFSGNAPEGLTVVPAAFGGVVILLAVVIGYWADAAERGLSRLAQRRGPSSAFTKLATVPGTLHGGFEAAKEVIRQPKPALLGAFVYWAFDIAALWASFRAFGAAPAVAVVVLGYYVGQLANTLPIPGGVGGVEGGMIGSFIAFGVNGSTAVLAVLAYRLISFWLPILPGTIAYLRLRGAVSRWREQNDQNGPAGNGATPSTATR
jgi:uncharacterized protein (TIRG00374 family)